MAKLSAHGREIDRFEFASYRTAIMSDGQILRDCGSGWKLYKKLKPEVNVMEYATKKRAEYDARPAIAHEFLRTIKDAVPLSLRWRLYNAITLMPNDPDGVWSEMDSPYSGNPVDIDDCVKLCRLYSAQLAAHSEVMA